MFIYRNCSGLCDFEGVQNFDIIFFFFSCLDNHKRFSTFWSWRYLFSVLEVSYAHPGCIYLLKITVKSLPPKALWEARRCVALMLFFLSHFASWLTTLLSNKDKNAKKKFLQKNYNGKLSNIIKC